MTHQDYLAIGTQATEVLDSFRDLLRVPRYQLDCCLLVVLTRDNLPCDGTRSPALVAAGDQDLNYVPADEAQQLLDIGNGEEAVTETSYEEEIVLGDVVAHGPVLEGNQTLGLCDVRNIAYKSDSGHLHRHEGYRDLTLLVKCLDEGCQGP
jgi:hypothetical protein